MRALAVGACAILLAALRAPARAEIALSTVDLPRAAGRIEAIWADSVAFRTDDGRAIKAPLEDVVRISFSPLVSGPLPGQLEIRLAGGDLLYGTILDEEAGGEAFLFQSRFAGRLKLALGAVRSIARIPPLSEDLERLHRRLALAGGRADAIFTAGGDELSGAVVSIAGTKLGFSSDMGRQDLRLEDVAAVALAGGRGASVAGGRPADLVAVAISIAGERLTGILLGLEGEDLKLRTPAGGELRIPLAGLSSIEIVGGRTVYLSDVEPSRVKETPYLDRVWHYRRDAAVGGSPLRIGGSAYEKGLGVHSGCEIAYDLAGGYESFQSDVGIDREAAGAGSVSFEVLVDGKKVFDSGSVAGPDAPRRVKVDLSNARELALVVTFGPEGRPQGDHADWAAARIIKAKGGASVHR